MEFLVEHAFVYGTSTDAATPDQVVVRIDTRMGHDKGSTIHVTTDPAQVHVFDTESGERLN